MLWGALSVLIASTKVPWNIKFWSSGSEKSLMLHTLNLEYFVHAIKKWRTKGVINELIITQCEFDITKLEDFPLEGLVVLRLVECKLNDTDMIHLSELMPCMKSLNALDIAKNILLDGRILMGRINAMSGITNARVKWMSGAAERRITAPGRNVTNRDFFQPLPHDFSNPCTSLQQDGLLRVLQQLTHSNVTSLRIAETGFCDLVENSPHDYYGVLKHLVHPSSGRLKTLSFGGCGVDLTGNRLISLAFGPSSLKNIIMYPPMFYVKSLNCLLSTTCITTLKIEVPDFLLFTSATQCALEVLRKNSFLRFLILGNFDVSLSSDIECLEFLVFSLYTLHSLSFILKGDPLYFFVASEYMKMKHRALTLDPRIHWYPEENIIHEFQGYPDPSTLDDAETTSKVSSEDLD
jgi:hypothetical protein